MILLPLLDIRIGDIAELERGVAHGAALELEATLKDYCLDETLESELARKGFILPNRSLSGPRGGNVQ